MKLSPSVPFNDMQERDAEDFYPFVIKKLNYRNLAYLHIGFEETPTIKTNWHKRLRPLYEGGYFANGGFTKEAGERLLADGGADAIAYGTLFLANPDLPERFAKNTELNAPDRATFYTPGEKGYTDYPSLEQAAHLQVLSTSAFNRTTRLSAKKIIHF